MQRQPLLGRIRLALCDSQAPWYGSDLVAWVGDLCDAVEKHHAAKGHDRCWENDRALYATCGLSVDGPALPPRDEFLDRCSTYYQDQLHGDRMD